LSQVEGITNILILTGISTASELAKEKGSIAAHGFMTQTYSESEGQDSSEYKDEHSSSSTIAFPLGGPCTKLK